VGAERKSGFVAARARMTTQTTESQMTTAAPTHGKWVRSKLLYLLPFLHLAWCLVLLVGIVAWRWGEAALKEIRG
jgi:hypothetical protein